MPQNLDMDIEKCQLVGTKIRYNACQQYEFKKMFCISLFYFFEELPISKYMW